MGTSDDDNRGDVIRYIQSYDDNGYLIRRMFKRDNRGSSGGTATRDENGAWGVGYLRDDLGRVVGTRSLDRDGVFMADSNGSAGYDYAYGESGRIVSETCVDLSGSPTAPEDNAARTVVEYDGLGHVVEIAYFDAGGERVLRSPDGVSVYRRSYDDRGFMIFWEAYDHMLEPCYDSSGTFSAVFLTDDNGRCLRSDLYGPDGKLQPCADGYASVTRTYTSNGQVTQERYWGADGTPALNLSQNLYGIDYTFTDGLLTRIDYFNDQGRPMRSKKGVASVCREYNGERQLSREWYLSEDGEPVRFSDGYAEACFSYTDGNRTRTDYYDETGAPCRDSSGVASYVDAFEAGQMTSRACLGPEGEPVLNGDGWHRTDWSYDEEGLLLRKCYYGTQGERVSAIASYSAVTYTYDSAGRVASKTYYDAENRECTPMERGASYYGASQLHYEYDQRGNLARKVYFPRTGVSAPGHVWDVVYTYDDYGNMTSERWRDRDGAPVVVSPGDGHGYSSYAYAEADYDAFGRVVEKRGYNAAGALTKRNDFVYDSHGRTIQVTTYGANGSVQLVEDNVYDEFGNRIQQAYTDGAGQPCMPTGEFALSRSAYDVFGNMTDRWIYDEAGNPCDGAFHEAYTYTVTGTALTVARYDANEQLIERSASTLDNYDRPVEVRVYMADGSCTGRVVYTYSPNGKLTECSYYDWAGSMVDFECREFYISEVLESSPAAEAGLRANDILIVYNLWSFSSTLVDPKETFTDLYLEIQAGQETDKHIVVCRVSEDFTEVTFIEVLLPVGQAGIRLGDGTVYSSGVSALVDAYEQWREGGSQEGAAFPVPA